MSRSALPRLLLQQLAVAAPATAVWDTLVFGDANSEGSHSLTAIGRTVAVPSPTHEDQPRRSIALDASIAFQMAVDLSAPSQFLSVLVSGDQWQNASEIQALWLLDPQTGEPWPNTAPGGAPSSSHSAMGSGGPLTHLDLVWGDNAPYPNGWQLMTTVLPPGLVARARTAGHSGMIKLNFTLGAIHWTDLCKSHIGSRAAPP